MKSELSMDWNHRWFLCGNCNSYIRTPKAFLNHKKEKCEGQKDSVTALRVTPEKKQRLSDDVFTKKSRTLGKFQCQFCQYATKKKHNLKLHIRRHTGERPFVCKLCNYVSSANSHLIMHSKCHAGETPFKCNECPASFNSRVTLGHHEARQHAIKEYQPHTSKVEPSIDISTDAMSKKFKCKFCKHVTKYFQDLERHMRIHTGMKPFVCKLCNYACMQPSNLTRHNRVHAGDTPFQCDECPASFNSRQTLGYHVAKQHRIEEYQPQRPKVELSSDISTDAMSKKFKCEFCKYVTKKLHNLKNHIRIHTGVRSFVCKLCNYAFNERASLTKHNRVHAGETPFKCSDCPASFNSRLTLGKHVARQHPIEEYQPQRSKVELPNDISTNALSKKFKCEFCEYVTKNFHDLKHHIRIHTGVKPFVCKLCNYAFAQASNLKAHNRVHVGDTPFKCNECPASFNNRRYLAVHIAKQHKERGTIKKRCVVALSPNRKQSLRVHSKTHTKKKRKCKCKLSAEFAAHYLNINLIKHGVDKPQWFCECNFSPKK